MEFPFINKKTQKVFHDVVECIPSHTRVYLVGGALRNALYYSIHKKRLPQRDYDMVIIGNHKLFFENLFKRGFEKGKIDRETQLVLKKRIKRSKEFQHSDFVVLDMVFKKNGAIKKELKENSNFVMNGSAILIQDMFKNWKKSVITLPGTLDNLKNKQIRLNPHRTVLRGTELFAILRFMSKGFKPPTIKEVQYVLKGFENIKKERFSSNVEKSIQLCWR